MNLNLIVFLTFSLFTSLLSGQTNSNSFEFIGTLQMPNDIIITYKINFTENTEGIIEGYSTTDFYGENKTKSKIEGVYDKKKNLISFDEIENISTKSSSDVDEFCFIHLKKGKIKTIHGKSIIQGSFKGKFPNGTSCVDGYLYLMSADFLDLVSNKVLNADVIKNEDSLKLAKQKYAELIKKTGETHLSNNNSLKINWSADEVIIEIWDAMEVDQDEVTIYINQQKILEKYAIRQERKILIVPFKEKVCNIKIVAVSEGSSPPNTVNIILRDGDVLTPIVTDLKIGEKASVILEKRKELNKN